MINNATFLLYRSSSTAATAAFAAATAGSANPKDHPKGISRYHSAGQFPFKFRAKETQYVVCLAFREKIPRIFVPLIYSWDILIPA